MTTKATSPETTIRIYKIATCSTLSGRSQLTYQVGSNAESEVFIRVTQNSGNGQFNSNWIPLVTIEKLLTAHPVDQPMSSRVLLPVFRSKSSNSPAFLFAAILAEGLVKVGTEKDSGYLLGSIEAFQKSVSALIANDTNLDAAITANPDVTKRKRKEATE